MKFFPSIAVLLLPLKAMACGLDWSPPVSHFENVDYQGHVHIVRKLGEAETLPIYLIFNSSFGKSPYVGSGFELPFLESRIWQIDESTFQAKSPAGWLWLFRRTKDPSVLDGNAGWKAVIKGDLITAWAPCGDRIVFKNGRIVSMRLKNDDFNYIYRNGRIASVEKNGRTLLEVQSNDKTGDVSGISLPASREEIGLDLSGERPVLESIAGKTLVTRLEKTLSEVTNSSGHKEAFHQVVNDEIVPTIKTEGSLIEWNPTSKKIMTEGEWTYDIKRADNPYANASIGRSRVDNDQKEFWHYDRAKGEETAMDVNGKTTIRKLFTSGTLNGKIRSVTEVISGKAIEIERYTYDETGRLVRFFKQPDTYTLTYDGSGLQDSLTHNDTLIWRKIKDQKGRIVYELEKNSFETITHYAPDNTRVVLTRTPNIALTVTYDYNNEPINVHFQ